MTELVEKGVPGVHADERLAQMGYKSELPRKLSMMAVLGLSFAIMAVPFGSSTTLSYSLINGGPVTVLYGWIFVSIISLCIGASLAEICSCYPTSGGVYFWSAMLCTPKWAPLVSYITGWLGLIGNLTVTTSICFSGGQLILSAIGLWNEDFAPKPWQVVLMYWAVLLIALAVNVFLAAYLEEINQICIYWTGASVIVIVVTILTMARGGRRSADFVFSNYDTSRAGWAPGWSFFVGLLQAAYTLTGYGLVASCCEEVCNPEREVPKAIVLSVAAAGITGVIYLIPVLFVLPDIDLALGVSTGQPIGYIFKQATGSAGGGFGLLFLILGILFFAAVGSLTATSRNLYAFSRDGAVPGSGLWSKVKLNVPLNALIACTIIQGLLGLIYLGSAAAFNAFTGVATICLSASYGVPILVLVIRGRHLVADAAFKLGKIGIIINLITVAWIFLAIVLFCMPTAVPVTDPGAMNYASVIFAFSAICSLSWYLIWGRKNFRGPQLLQVGAEGGNHVMPVSTLDGHLAETGSNESPRKKEDASL
ncbi:amino acid/polyamine transporter I [Protomyces lactucae-debilis]|uniref:Amino acid/polyamine transporter I n=1 Tax=Protomyces lactucae-debilis TaxID=2754530 RepID=A0A1Y2EV09_PROLT|nr:amino acid/polyamine transporter I [Protomyces lactucae-debilis]ORY75441.1 amino acid/polyamine transporter I [Protomyces lactucae-debilis]